MPKFNPIQTNFTAGELSPRIKGRVDIARYSNGVGYLENFILMPQGGVYRRSGTRFVNEVKDSTRKTRLIPFEFSSTQAYILEFGNLYIRFYKDGGRIEVGGNPVELVTPWTESDLAELNWTQSADVLYVCHPNYQPRKISRTSHTAWTIENLLTIDGPYLSENDTSTTITASGSTGNITLTASSALFAATDVNRLVRLRSTSSKKTETRYVQTLTSSGGQMLLVSKAHGFVAGERVEVSGIVGINGATKGNGTWFISVPNADQIILVGSDFTGSSGDYNYGGIIRPISTIGYAVITGYTSPTQVSATVEEEVPTTATKNWRLGAWSNTSGWPRCVTFHEQRLCFAATQKQPQTVWMSRSADYENFGPTELDHKVLDDNAVTYTIASNKVNAIRWMESGGTLFLGTIGAEWQAKASRTSEAITPSNIQVVQQTAFGSSLVRPVRIGSSALFVQRSGRKVRELSYSLENDGFVAKDISLLGEHLVREGGGIVDSCYQQEPDSIYWGLRTDGVMVGLTYLKEQEIIGWQRVILGGAYQNTNAQVESIASIPTPTIDQDALWMVVKRTINGTTKRYIEYLEKPFDPQHPQDKESMFFVDSGLTYDNPKTITGATAANPVVITSNAHGFSNGDQVLITEVEGMTELNNDVFTVANATANTFQLSGVNGTAYSAYTSGGKTRKLVQTISGLGHLEGQTVQIIGDGSHFPEQTVSGSAITLDKPAAFVHVGLGYTSKLQTLPPEGGGASGTAQGKLKRQHKIAIRFFNTLSGLFGSRLNKLTPMTFRTTQDPMDFSPPLFTGDRVEYLNQSYELEGSVWIVQDQPYPMTILAIMKEGAVYD